MRGSRTKAFILLAAAGGTGCAVLSLSSREPPAGIRVSLERQEPAALTLGADGEGGTVVAFARPAPHGAQQAAARKFSPDGSQAWETVLSGSAQELAALKTVRARNGWYFLWKENGVSGWRWLAQRLDSGGKGWAAPVQLAALASSRFELSACLGADDSLIAAFNDQNPGTRSVYVGIVKAAPDGTVAWRRELGKDAPRAWFQQPQLAPDDAGGAFLSYHQIDDQDKGIVLQHFSTFGEALWGEGADIYDMAKYNRAPVMLSDGQGGLIVLWEDGRSGNLDVYAQHVGPSGQTLWGRDGLALATGQGDQSGPVAVSDGRGGIFAAWVDDNDGNFWDIHGRHVNGKGELSFSASGQEIAPSIDKRARLMIVPEGRGNAYVCWQEPRDGENGLYCQKMTASGEIPWERTGKPMILSAQYLEGLELAPDWENGLLAAWGVRGKGTWEVRVQRFDPEGEPLWPAPPAPEKE